MMLQDKTVVLGVSGSIAAYKTAYLASALKKAGADVHVIMTGNALNFINPITFETLTGNKCLVDTFDRNFEFSVEHVSLGKKADIMMIAPATANVIGKLASGIADDMLTTTAMACRAPIYLAPAMNTAMYENPVTQDNINKLKGYGYHIIEPASGYLACGDVGPGKMPEPADLYEIIEHEVGHEKDLAGRKIMITAGPTRESIDPVRYITNHSTGKMGYAIARAASRRGAEVTLISGPVDIKRPAFVHIVDTVSAGDMYDAVMKDWKSMDAVIMAAAVADYRPAQVAEQKVKKKDGDLNIALERTQDILGTIGDEKYSSGDQNLPVICGFSMETENMVENSKKKLQSKHADMIVANNLRQAGAGFGTDTNVVTFIRAEGMNSLPIMTKDEVADAILNEISAMMK